jgi:hypothetical protein
MNKTIIKTERSPAAIGPYNQGIVAGGFLRWPIQEIKRTKIFP